MKATIDLPEDLYRRVKAKSALQGRAVREVTAELYQKWLDDGTAAQPAASGKWLKSLMRRSIPADLPGQTAREILEEGRNRLELRRRP